MFQNIVVFGKEVDSSEVGGLSSLAILLLSVTFFYGANTLTYLLFIMEGKKNETTI